MCLFICNKFTSLFCNEIADWSRGSLTERNKSWQCLVLPNLSLPNLQQIANLGGWVNDSCQNDLPKLKWVLRKIAYSCKWKLPIINVCLSFIMNTDGKDSKSWQWRDIYQYFADILRVSKSRIMQSSYFAARYKTGWKVFFCSYQHQGVFQVFVFSTMAMLTGISGNWNPNIWRGSITRMEIMAIYILQGSVPTSIDLTLWSCWKFRYMTTYKFIWDMGNVRKEQLKMRPILYI